MPALDPLNWRTARGKKVGQDAADIEPVLPVSDLAKAPNIRGILVGCWDRPGNSWVCFSPLAIEVLELEEVVEVRWEGESGGEGVVVGGMAEAA